MVVVWFVVTCSHAVVSLLNMEAMFSSETLVITNVRSESNILFISLKVDLVCLPF